MHFQKLLFMKYILFSLLLLAACGKKGPCTHEGRALKKNAEGKCYYIGESGAEIFVEDNECNC